jgi:hypothetical protein
MEFEPFPIVNVFSPQLPMVSWIKVQSSGWIVKDVDICVIECFSVDTSGPPERTG